MLILMNGRTKEMQDSYDSWLEYSKKFPSKEEMNDHLRERMKKFIKETKTTQREIARKTKINESALSQWKNNKDIGISDNNKNLFCLNVGSLNTYLSDMGY